MIDFYSKPDLLLVSSSFYSFTQFEYQLFLDVTKISSYHLHNTTFCSVSRKKIIYLVVPHLHSANSEQNHRTLVSYLEMRIIRSSAVC